MPEIAVDVWYKVGWRDEAPGRTGFAHLFEHVMFQGTKHVAEDKHFEYPAEGRGVERQRIDVARPHQLLRGRPVEPARARAVAGERAHGLPARSHRLQGDRRQPARRRQERAPPALREPPRRADLEGAAARRSTRPTTPTTTRSSARWRISTAASVDDVKAFFRTYYAPDNATLVIAGDFDRAKTKELVEQYFGPIPAGEPITRRPAPAVRLTAVKRIAMEAKIQQPQLYVTYPTPANFAPGDRELDVLGHRAGRRQVVAPLQAAGLRHEDRPVGDRRPAEPAAVVELRDHRLADARPHAGRDPGRDRRGDRRGAGQAAGRRRSWTAPRTSSSRTPSAASRACLRAPSGYSPTTTWSAIPASSPRICAVTAPSTPPPSSASPSST